MESLAFFVGKKRGKNELLTKKSDGITFRILGWNIMIRFIHIHCCVYATGALLACCA